MPESKQTEGGQTSSPMLLGSEMHAPQGCALRKAGCFQGMGIEVFKQCILDMATENDDHRSRRARLFELVSKDILDAGPGFDELSDLFDAGLDSMAIMQLLILIEQNFGVRFPIAKLTRDNLSSVADLACLLESEIASG